MGQRLQPLIEAAKLLSIREREELLEALLEIDAQIEHDTADVAEWNRRYVELETGVVEGIDADDAIAAARADLHLRHPGALT